MAPLNIQTWLCLAQESFSSRLSLFLLSYLLSHSLYLSLHLRTEWWIWALRSSTILPQTALALHTAIHSYLLSDCADRQCSDTSQSRRTLGQRSRLLIDTHTHTVHNRVETSVMPYRLLWSGLQTGPLTPENASQLLINHPWQSGLLGKGQKTSLVVCHLDSITVFRQHIFPSVRFVILSKHSPPVFPMSLLADVCNIYP